MRIKITRATVCNGAPVEVNQVVDTDEKTARLLVNIGKAVAHEGKQEDASQESNQDAGGKSSKAGKSNKAGKDKGGE